MKTKIAINGFGRIGRIAFRIAEARNDIEIVAINDLLEVSHLAYLLKYDSVHGRFNGDVKVDQGHLVVNGRQIRVTAERDPAQANWAALDVDVVLECTGIFTAKETAQAHLNAGAKRVVISAPSKDAPMFVMGVNHTSLTASETIISNASCTTNCLAPMAQIVQDNFGLEEGLMTTVHASTASQFPVDSPARKDFRLGRSALTNIIPASTGAAVAVTKVIPALKGKLTGMAFRVPTADVSVVDLTLRTQKATSYEAILEAFKTASETTYKGIVAFVDDAVVSQDFVSNTYTCNFDAQAGMALNQNFFKLVAWYDNEYGYSAKLLDLASHAATL